MVKEIIGHTPCPLCGFPHQEVRLTDGGKPYITCDECGMQLFARQPKAVRILRAKAAENPAQAQQAAPAAKPAPSVAPSAETPKPEKTIFDFFDGGD